MPRFDIYRNPNPRASHAPYLDVQSDLVTTATRWCIPLFAASPSHALVGRAQVLLTVLNDRCVVDTAMSLHRSGREASFDPEEVDLLGRLVLHLSRALDRLGSSVVLLDRPGS